MKELTPYQKAALDYSRHISLTANAGSGKTFVLSRRFVEIALSESIPLNSIVAITFTDKAAGELSRKIANEIDDRIAGEKDFKVIRKLERLRNQLVFANISTIHSFCINILKEFSPEAGIDADFIPIDANNSEELIDLSVQEILKEGFSDPVKAEKLKYLIRFFGSKNGFVDKIKSFVEKRKNLIGFYEKVYKGTAEDISRFYTEKFEEDFSILFAPRLKEASKAVKTVNDAALEENPKSDKALLIKSFLKKYKPGLGTAELFGIFKEISGEMLTEKLTVAKRGYLNKGRDSVISEIAFVENLAGDLSYFDSIENPEATGELAVFAGSLAEIIIEINNRYESKKRQKGYLDFEDILLKTRDILVKEEVKKYLEQKYRYIMVDEYQDTNEIQYEIIMPILDNLNSGNLCVVGDEKQSIYMFRDADLEVFDRTKKRIAELKEEESLLTLPHSFRLAPGIALFINHLFSRLFANPEPVFNEVEHSDLFCARTDDAKGEVEFILRDSESKTGEAELVAAKIISLYNSRKIISRFSDVLILCRKRNSFKELEETFARFKIPFALIGGKGFFQKQTTLDVYNYLSFLLNKDNDAALLGILRAPFYSLSDTELMAVSLCGGAAFYEKFRNYSGSDEKTGKIALQLEKHLNEINTYSFSSLIRKILNDTSYWGVVSERSDSVQEIANLEKLISNARSFSLQGYKTLYDYVEHLKEAIATRDDEGQAEIIDNSDSVKIMTIHQAKGLEAKAVFLYSANERERDNGAKSKDAAVDKNYGIIAKVPPKRDYFEKYVTPPITGLHNYIVQKKNSAETRRLLYVALTRAVDYLCVSASHSEFKFSSGSLADYLFNTLGINEGVGKINIKDNLTRLFMTEQGYTKSVNPEEISIPVISEIPVEDFDYADEEERQGSLDILTGTIKGREKNEFISASKISVFAQCPFKYYLTYEIGFAKLHRRMKSFRENFEFSRKEDEGSTIMADLRGSIIHEILEKEITPDKLDEYVKDITERTLASGQAETGKLDKIERNIIEDMKKFYSSPLYERIKSFARCKNEFEVYAAEDDYFLYGIVDKIVFDNDRIIIIDYKTDSISKDEIKERGEGYFNQLKFYAYAVSKSTKKQYKFELWIVFIKHPEEAVVTECTPEDLAVYKTSLSGIISDIRGSVYNKNRAHCPKCHLSDENNECVDKDKIF